MIRVGSSYQAVLPEQEEERTECLQATPDRETLHWRPLPASNDNKLKVYLQHSTKEHGYVALMPDLETFIVPFVISILTFV